jgi:hypothetical protein
MTLLITGTIASYLIFNVRRHNSNIETETKEITTSINTLTNQTKDLGILLNADIEDGRLLRPPYLKLRQQGIPDIKIQAKTATEIWVVCVTGRDLVQSHGAFLREKCMSGCKLKVLISDESSDALQVWGKWYETNDKRDVEKEVRKTRNLFVRLPKGRAQVNCLNEFIPFVMFATDPKKETGEIVIAFQTYRGFSGDRPYIWLKAMENPYWYNLFCKQFELMWKHSKPTVATERANV